MYVKFVQQDGSWTHLMEAPQVSVKSRVVKKKDVDGECGQLASDQQRSLHRVWLKEGQYEEIGENGVIESEYTFGTVLVDLMDAEGRVFDKVMVTTGKVYLMNENGKTLDAFAVPIPLVELGE